MTINELADEFCVFTARMLLTLCIIAVSFYLIAFIHHEVKAYLYRTRKSRAYKRYCRRKRKADKAYLNREVRWK